MLESPLLAELKQHTIRPCLCRLAYYWSFFLYTLNTTAIGVRKGLNKRWEEVDLTTPTLASLFDTYRILQIVVTPQGSPDPEYLMLSDLSGSYLSSTLTVQGMLTADFATASLPTRTLPLIVGQAVARFYDAFRLRYQIKVVDNDNVEPPNTASPDDFDHVRIDRPDTIISSADAVANVLVNVNGFYHLVENIGDRGIFIRDALKSLRQSGQNQIALWDFRELGGVTVLPTVPGALHTSNTAWQVALAQDVSEKTVFFVVGGYFFPVDGTVVSQNGTGRFLIDFLHPNFRAPARYYEAANYIDMSTVAAAAQGEVPGTVDIDALSGADAITAWMGLSQTFAVIINRKDTYVQRRYLQSTGNPNQYFCYLDRDLSNVANEIENVRLSLHTPDLPMVLDLGRQPPYWSATERWVHSFTIYNNRIGQLLYESGQPTEGVVTSGADQPGSPGVLQHAFLLEFGSDVAFLDSLPLVP
jgi:hypothetical protein